MRFVKRAAFLGLLAVSWAGCSSPRPLPKYERPIARTSVQTVRTTAYTDTESDHRIYTNHNALGGILLSGPVQSAAADWSRWPAGTVFRIVETGEIYRVDDYGWALAGTNTIDLYKPSRAAMNRWGVRRVTIENLQWGTPGQSLKILRPRSRFRHVQRMIAGLESRYRELSRPLPPPVSQGLFSSGQIAALSPAGDAASRDSLAQNNTSLSAANSWNPSQVSAPQVANLRAANASSWPAGTATRALPVSSVSGNATGSAVSPSARDPFFGNSNR